MHLLAVQAKSMHSFYYGLILKMEARSSLSFAASWDRSGILLRRFRSFFSFSGYYDCELELVSGLLSKKRFCGITVH